MDQIGTVIMALGAVVFAGAAQSADLRVEVKGLRSQQGTLLVAVCTPETFTRRGCPHVAVTPASDAAAVVEGIPPGTWALQVIHDEDANGTLTRRGFLPDEGIGFSRDAPMRMGPPRFSDAAFQLNASGTISVTMRYFQ